MFIFSVPFLSSLTTHNSLLTMSTKTQQPSGLPVMLLQGSPRFAVSAFNPALGTSYKI
jgi:hypothetical protein